MSKENPRQLTEADAKDVFLRYAAAVDRYWAELPDKTAEERVRGAIFSMLVALDGDAMAIPGYSVAVLPRTTPEDIEFARKEGYDFYPAINIPNGAIDIAGDLHGHVYRYFRGEIERPSDYYDFGDFLNDYSRFVNGGD